MKFLILIAASCMFVTISGQEVADGSAEVTVESLTAKASDLFSKFSMMQSDINNDIINDYLNLKIDVLNEKLERLACKRTSDLIVAKTDALTQLEQNKLSMAYSSPTAIKLCSITATIDLDLYVNPEISNGIATELMYYKSTLTQIQSASFSLFYDYEIYNEYSSAVYGDNVTVESLQAYIDKVTAATLTYKYDTKTKAQNLAYKMDSLVSQFNTRSQGKAADFQTILSNLNMDFNSCVSNNYAL